MADLAFMRIGLNIVGHQDMANSEPSPGLQPKDFTEQRNDALREGVKGLFLMNGGGTVAMLAFLQAIWKENPQHSQVCPCVYRISHDRRLLGRISSVLQIPRFI